MGEVSGEETRKMPKKGHLEEQIDAVLRQVDNNLSSAIPRKAVVAKVKS